MFLRTGAFFSSILSEFLKNLVALQRRSYQLTAEGETLLQNEVERLQAQVRDYEKLFER